MLNREITTITALAMLGNLQGSLAPYTSKSGAITFASARKAFKAEGLKGNALTNAVNEAIGQADSEALATVIQLSREGFHFQKLASREMKSGATSVSVKLSNFAPKSSIKLNEAQKARAIAELSETELEALLTARREAKANKGAIEA